MTLNEADEVNEIEKNLLNEQDKHVNEELDKQEDNLREESAKEYKRVRSLGFLDRETVNEILKPHIEQMQKDHKEWEIIKQRILRANARGQGGKALLPSDNKPADPDAEMKTALGDNAKLLFG